MRKIIAIVIILVLVLSSFTYAKDRYAVKMKDGKVVSWQMLSDKYLEEHAADPSCPLQQGYIIVNSMEGLEIAEPPLPKTEKEKLSELLKDEDIKAEIIALKESGPVMMGTERNWRGKIKDYVVNIKNKITK